VRLLSEDSPLIDRSGQLHPFPLRIGVGTGAADLLPAGQVRRLERLWLEPKVAVEVASFAERVERMPQPLRHLVVGRRALGRRAALDPLPRRSALVPLLTQGVLGTGVYQGLGFAHQRGVADLIAKVPIALGRARSCLAGLARADVWRLTLGHDHDRNWEVLLRLLLGDRE
jgi:hypothetical protein